MAKYLKAPVSPVGIDPKMRVKDLLEAMGGTGFQAKGLSLALDIWKRMLEDEVVIFLGLAGAMVPAGMRKVVRYLIERRMIDCLVSTGANLFHDVHESLGRCHWQGSCHVDDLDLKKEKVNRIYDVFASETEFAKTDAFIADFASALDRKRPYTTREFLRLLGEALAEGGKEEGILTAASKHGVPVYCPAVGDSSIGIALAVRGGGAKVIFDAVADVEEMARIVIKFRDTGVIYIGGGTPKNFIQQTEVTAPLMGGKAPGHKYAVQITCDSPQWGGLSGCTFEEAQSWGKISEKAQKAMVFCDATIALPLIVTALAQTPGLVKGRRVPKLDF